MKGIGMNKDNAYVATSTGLLLWLGCKTDRLIMTRSYREVWHTQYIKKKLHISHRVQTKKFNAECFCK